MVKIINVITGKTLGGSKQVFLDYCSMLNNLEHEVFPILRKDSSVHHKFLKDLPHLADRLKFIKYKRIPIGIYKKKAIAEWRSLYQELKPDLIITQKPIDSFFISQAKLPCPVLVVIHGFSLTYLNYATGLIAVSQAVLDFLKKHGVKTPINLVYNSIKIDIGKKNNNLSNKKSEKVVLGTMCVFRRKKNLILLLKACALLKKQGIEFKLIIAGSGRQKFFIYLYRYLLNLEPDVEIRPWVNDKEKFFNEIDLFCVTSKAETFNLTIIEAMAHQKAVISTNCQGPIEIIDHKEDGVLVYSKRPEDYANALKELITNCTLREKLAKAGFQKAYNKFSSAIAEANLNNIIEKIL